MNIYTLDLIFPFFVFAYGALITFVLSFPQFERLAERLMAQGKLPQQAYQQMKAHRILALICLCIGGLWSLQNLWL